MDDARIAVETGVDGLDIVIGTSPQLMQYSHGKSMDYIRDTALEVKALPNSAAARLGEKGYGSLELLADMARAIGDSIRQIQGLGMQIFI